MSTEGTTLIDRQYGPYWQSWRARRDSREYRSYDCMIRRCYMPTFAGYDDYGAKGVTVCDRWRRFAPFFEDMGPCPFGMTIDRIDNDGNYEPGNCRWATRIEQAANRSDNFMVTWRGETLPLATWARRLGLPYMMLFTRLKRRRWSIEDAFTIRERRTPTTGPAHRARPGATT